MASNNGSEAVMYGHGLRRMESGFAAWDKEHGEYPRNWSTTRKSYDMTMIAFFQFYATLVSTTGPSAATYAMEELRLSRTLAIAVFTITYQLGLAIGSLLVPPFSESFGRRKMYVCSCAVFSVGNILSAVVPYSPVAAIVVGRFICGLVSAVPTVVIAGSVDDLFQDGGRICLVLTWNTSANLALAVGPIYGTYIAAFVGWRCVYYSAAIISAVLCVALFFLRETRPSVLLAQKVDAANLQNGDKSLGTRGAWAVHATPDTISHPKQLINVILVRPVRLGLTEPIVIMVSVLSATASGLIYLFTESFAVTYAGFGWPQTSRSLPFLAILLGFPFSFFPRLKDLRNMARRRQLREESEPEDNLLGFAFAAPAMAIGLWLFSWTIPPFVHIPWVVSMVGLVSIGFALNEIEYTLNGYLTDSYTGFASSAVAALSCTKAWVSGCLPLFGHQMFSELGPNIAGSIVAAFATVFCLTPVVFFRYGKAMRTRSKFARYSLGINRQERGQVTT